MEAMGVDVHLEKITAEVLGDGRVTGLAFKDGSTLDCDMVVISAGIQPNAEIGMRCGLTVERAHRRRQPHALGRRLRTSTSSASARSTAA